MENVIFYYTTGLAISIISDFTSGGFTVNNCTDGLIIRFECQHRSFELYIKRTGTFRLDGNVYSVSMIETVLKDFFS